MGFYTKKPVMIEAIQFDERPEQGKLIVNWINSNRFYKKLDGQAYLENDRIYVPTLEGTITASIGDWIIRGVQGEFYPCKPDVFEMTYEKE